MKHIAGVSKLFYLEIPKKLRQKYSCMMSLKNPTIYNFYCLLFVIKTFPLVRDHITFLCFDLIRIFLLLESFTLVV